MQFCSHYARFLRGAPRPASAPQCPPCRHNAVRSCSRRRGLGRCSRSAGRPGTRRGGRLGSCSQGCFLAAEPGRSWPLGSGAGTATYWAAWADALPVLRERSPDAADRLVRELEGAPSAPCLGAPAYCGGLLKADPTGNLAPEALTYQRLRANSASEALVGSNMPFSHLTLPFENARCFRPWLLPLEPSSTLNPVRMPVCGWPRCLRMRRPPSHVAMRRRLRLPLPLTDLRCGAEGRYGCGGEVDAYGDHHFACPRTGLLPRRGFVVEHHHHHHHHATSEIRSLTSPQRKRLPKRLGE